MLTLQSLILQVFLSYKYAYGCVPERTFIILPMCCMDINTLKRMHIFICYEQIKVSDS